MNSNYQTREDELNKVLNLESPDRVLIAPHSEHFFSTRRAGISNKVAMNDHKARFSAMLDTFKQFNFDLAQFSGVYPAQMYAALGAKYFKWPGAGLPDDQPFQFVEKEYLLADEYDQFLANPDDFTLRVLWPRMAENFEPLKSMTSLLSTGPDPLFFGLNFADPGIISVLKSMMSIGEQAQAWMDAEQDYISEVKELGYPITSIANFTPPFDLVADYLRGLRGVMLDMYRMPEKLMAAVDLYVQPQIEAAIAWAEAVENPRITFWLHRGAAGFMSDEHYRKFYWPSLRTVVDSLVEAGFTPVLFAQGDYTPRLPDLAELPRGKVPIHYDRIDRQQAKEIMADRQCFWGGVSSALLSTGKPDQVKEDVKELIDMVAPNGGLIVDGSVGIPDEARPENVEAMVEAVHQFGVS